MKFEIVQVINHPLEIVEKVLLSKDYIEYLKKNHSQVEEINIEEYKEEGNIIKRRIYYQPKRIIEKILSYEIPKEAMAWIEVSSYDKSKHEMEFDNLPVKHKVRELMINRGTMRLEPSSGNKTKRIIKGELKIKVFMIGKVAEKIIYQKAEKILEEEVRCLENYIEELKSEGKL